MKKLISAILFDKDGTLTQTEKVWDPYYLSVIQALAKISNNTIEDIARSCNFNLLKGESSKNSILWTGTPSAIIQHWSDKSNIPYEQVKQIAETLYEYIDYNHPVIHNIQEVINNISQQTPLLGIATMDHTSLAKKTMKSLGIETMIPYYYGSDTCKSKPSPDMIYKFSKSIGVPVEQILVVGDSVIDIQMANNANAIGVGVLTGSANQRQLEQAGALTVLQDISYLLDFLSALHEK